MKPTKISLSLIALLSLTPFIAEAVVVKPFDKTQKPASEKTITFNNKLRVPVTIDITYKKKNLAQEGIFLGAGKTITMELPEFFWFDTEGTGFVAGGTAKTATIGGVLKHHEADTVTFNVPNKRQGLFSGQLPADFTEHLVTINPGEGYHNGAEANPWIMFDGVTKGN